MNNVTANLETLTHIENRIIHAVDCAQRCLLELSKEKFSAKSLDTQGTEFMKTLNEIEQGLSRQIDYLNRLGVGSVHAHTAFVPVRQAQQAEFRRKYISSRLSDADVAGQSKAIEEQVGEVPEPMDQSEQLVSIPTVKEEPIAAAESEVSVEIKKEPPEEEAQTVKPPKAASHDFVF